MCEVLVLFDGYSEQIDDQTMRANCSCTLIKGPKLIIVDTMTAWDQFEILEALNRENIAPMDIDYVVCTHSHADHIGNNNLFTNAEHIIGYCVHRNNIFYEKDIKNGVYTLRYYTIDINDNISLRSFFLYIFSVYVPVPYSLCEGVKVIATPGHTAEDVTVLVESDIDGQLKCFAITGDLFEKESDISDPSIWKNLGNPELQKVQSLMRSRIINLADVIIPGHGTMFHVTDSMRKLVDSQIIV